MYNVYIFGNTETNFVKSFTAELVDRFKDFGLREQEHFNIVKAPKKIDLNTSSELSVGIWLGDGNNYDTQQKCAEKLLAQGCTVYPVVSDLSLVATSLPNFLQRFNAMEESNTHLSAEVLSSFNLIRKKRKIFISYKRDEASGLANQLFERLSHAGYAPFLDTASISKGADFQADLFEELSDVDLVILLYTKTALKSQWVKEEMLKAQAHGISVLQLICPDAANSSHAFFNVEIKLKDSDFDTKAFSRRSALIKTSFEKVMLEIEKQRIVSIASRKNRVTKELLALIEERDLVPTIQFNGSVDISNNSNEVLATVVPQIGLPDTASIYKRVRSCEANNKEQSIVRIAYDELSIGDELYDILNWLNSISELKTTPMGKLNNWLAKL